MFSHIDGGRNQMKRVIGLAAAALLSLGMVAGFALSASAATRPVPKHYAELGGLDLAGYCASLGDTVVVPRNITGTNAAKHWKCKPVGGKAVAVNLKTACADAYPSNTYLLSDGTDFVVGAANPAVPFIQDVNNAYSIVCISKIIPPAVGLTLS